MFQSPRPIRDERAIRRLKAFDLYEDVDPDFDIALPILAQRARDVAIAYTDHYMRTIKAFPDEEKRAAFVDRVTAGFKGRYDTPVSPEWVKKGEEIAHNIHGRGADLADHLSALSVAQVKEIMVVYEGVEDPADGIRIAAKMSRLQALDAEILLSTVKELQTQKHFEWVQREINQLHAYLGEMVEDTAKKSHLSKLEAREAGQTSQELAELSQFVMQASIETAKDMAQISADAGQLRKTLDQLVQELSRSSTAMRDAISIGEVAVDAVDALSAKSSSIESIAALIEDITDRSDVLSLNASIEAARAGEAGVGFAVVANEMKDMSRQTASATNQIFSQIEAIRSARGDALGANRSMLNTFANVSEMTEVVRQDVSDKSVNVVQISQRVDQTAQRASQSLQSLGAMNELAGGLSQRVEKAGHSLGELGSQIEAMRKGTFELLNDLTHRASLDVGSAPRK